MKFKLDENFGTRTQRLFHAAGHDVETVYGEGISGCSDQRLCDLCWAEGRCLVTLDLDFADVIRFPPARTAGIVVIRVPRNPSLTLLEQLVDQFLEALDRASLEKHLWIVEIGRIRIHQSEKDE
jgi:predicted nuclease of predicted toxin-antitoxin system